MEKKPLQPSTSILILLLSFSLSALAPVGDLYAGDNPKTVQAIRTAKPPRIDGFLNDEVWNLAQPINDFLQRDPNEGAPASERTTIRVLYDDDALYFGCMMEDSEPAKIVARRTRRDNEIESDYISIRIDSFHDHQTAFEFTLNASGSKTDILIYDDKKNEDASWDVVWEAETQILPNGWSAEFKIPFSVLRFSKQAKQEWGINFIRRISRKQERAFWALIGRTQSGFVSRFGHLVGMDDLPSPVRLEVLPYVVGRQEFRPTSGPGTKDRNFLGNLGLDLKYGLRSYLTLDATLNPDFGQVEADPAVLNLSTYETFFPEKRPFFIEGTQILRFTTFGERFGPGLFYSRRIGRALQEEVSVPKGGYILEKPSTATILGAVKISGKTPSGLAIGILEAVTQEETAKLVDSLGRKSKHVVEPFAHYNVVRVRQDFWENSNIGGIFTTVAKESRRPAFVLGADWNLRFKQNTYVLDGFVAASHTTTRLDRRISGSAGRVQFQKVAGTHWLWRASLDYTTQKYNVNDIGFFRRPDNYGSWGELRYREETPGKTFQRYSFGLGHHLRMNFDGINLFRQVHWSGEMVFRNFWKLDLRGNFNVGLYDDRESRGRGLYRRPSSLEVNLSLESDPRSPIIGELELGYERDNRGSYGFSIGGEILIRPLSWVDLTIFPRFNSIRNKEAWFRNYTNPSNSQVASLFGDRDTDELDFTLRGTLTFARDLTLQVYAQVFLAKGHYDGIRELVAPNAFRPFSYSENPDFNRKSFNTNVVLRWEYLPGSTLYLVWSQARSGEGQNYFTSVGRDFRDTFKVPSANVLLLKVSYWWGL